MMTKTARVTVRGAESSIASGNTRGSEGSEGSEGTEGSAGFEGAEPSDAPSNLSLLRAFRWCAHLQRLLGAGNHGQDRLLVVLSEAPGAHMAQGSLARVAQRQPATLSQQLETMEQAGWVTRRPSEQDRRAVEVSLTEAGRAEAARARERRQATADAAFGGLAPQDRAQLASILDELGARWKSLAFGEEPPEPGPQGRQVADKQGERVVDKQCERVVSAQPVPGARDKRDAGMSPESPAGAVPANPRSQG